jgi:hypothetical protein
MGEFRLLPVKNTRFLSEVSMGGQYRTMNNYFCLVIFATKIKNDNKTLIFGQKYFFQKSDS